MGLFGSSNKTALQKQQANQKKKPLHKYNNPFEMLKEHGKEAGENMGKVPQEIMQRAVDQMWGDLLGMPKPEWKAEVKGNESNSTELIRRDLELKYMQQDAKRIEELTAELAESQQADAEHASRHRQYQSESEGVQKRIEAAEEQKKKEELQEEQEKKRMEEEEKQRQQQEMAMPTSVQKGPRLPGGRKKASVEQQFETRTGYGSK